MDEETEVVTAPWWIWVILSVIACISFWVQATVTEERYVRRQCDHGCSINVQVSSYSYSCGKTRTSSQCDFRLLQYSQWHCRYVRLVLKCESYRWQTILPFCRANCLFVHRCYTHGGWSFFAWALFIDRGALYYPFIPGSRNCEFGHGIVMFLIDEESSVVMTVIHLKSQICCASRLLVPKFSINSLFVREQFMHVSNGPAWLLVACGKVLWYLTKQVFQRALRSQLDQPKVERLSLIGQLWFGKSGSTH